MTELEKAKSDMDFYRHKGGFGYKQAKKHYEKILRKWKYEQKQSLRATVYGEQIEDSEGDRG